MAARKRASTLALARWMANYRPQPAAPLRRRTRAGVFVCRGRFHWNSEAISRDEYAKSGGRAEAGTYDAREGGDVNGKIHQMCVPGLLTTCVPRPRPHGIRHERLLAFGRHGSPRFSARNLLVSNAANAQRPSEFAFPRAPSTLRIETTQSSPLRAPDFKPRIRRRARAHVPGVQWCAPAAPLHAGLRDARRYTGMLAIANGGVDYCPMGALPPT